ncbi:hypothetical protein FRC08_008385 [Ceratobasidium sp. 394]|nr:hypothetical protein FRC08_008385 [Ceratobasidium sp. 394]
MKPSAKSFGLRLAGALQDAGRSTVSAAMGVAPLPGFEEVKDVALRLVDSIQSLESHQTKRAMLSHRITTTIGMLETHLRNDEPSLELQYFFNKMITCQKKLLGLESKRGVPKALRAAQQLEMMEMLEREISSDFQDAILALLLQRLSPSPRPESQPVITITQPTPETDITPNLQAVFDYPKVTRCELSLNTIVRRTRGSEPNSPLIKSVASGKYQGRNVLVVQYSSKVQQEDALKAFLSDVSTVIREQHPNVLEFVGASDDISCYPNHFMVFDAGYTVSRETFLRSAHSAEQIFRFLGGVKSGMECLLDHGVHTWHDICVADNGRAVIHPPYWETDFSWDKSNVGYRSS